MRLAPFSSPTVVSKPVLETGSFMLTAVWRSSINFLICSFCLATRVSYSCMKIKHLQENNDSFLLLYLLPAVHLKERCMDSHYPYILQLFQFLASHFVADPRDSHHVWKIAGQVDPISTSSVVWRRKYEIIATRGVRHKLLITADITNWTARLSCWLSHDQHLVNVLSHFSPISSTYK